MFLFLRSSINAIKERKFYNKIFFLSKKIFFMEEPLIPKTNSFSKISLHPFDRNFENKINDFLSEQGVFLSDPRSFRKSNTKDTYQTCFMLNSPLFMRRKGKLQTK